MKLLPGTGGQLIGTKVANIIGCAPVNNLITSFADGESRVEILDSNLFGETVFVIQSTNKDSYIIELLLILDALKRLGVSKINLIIPYFGYSRSDRIVQSGSAIAAKVMANILGHNASSVTVVDVHFDQFESLFDIPVYNLFPDKIFGQYFAHSTDLQDAVVVAPDLGAVKRSRAFAKNLGLEVVIINKMRSSIGESDVVDLIGNPKNKNCIIVDDIVCGAGTLCNAAHALKKVGAKSVLAFITHGVLSGRAQERIKKSSIDNVVITDTIQKNIECDKIKVISVADLIAQKIKDLGKNCSLWK